MALLYLVLRYIELFKRLRLTLVKLILSTFQCVLFSLNLMLILFRFLKEQKRTLLITSFHDWFKNYVFDWIKVAQLKMRERLDRALELDTIVDTNDNVPFSSSAVDTHAFFLQVYIVHFGTCIIFLQLFFSLLGYQFLEGSQMASQRPIIRLLYCYLTGT